MSYYTFYYGEQNMLDFHAVLRWCEERFGDDDPDASWYSHNGSIFFRDERHGMEFKLRWM